MVEAAKTHENCCISRLADGVLGDSSVFFLSPPPFLIDCGNCITISQRAVWRRICGALAW
jgi:hypothetical protein